MTIFDLLCDRCGAVVTGPAGLLNKRSARRGVRFAYHPDDQAFADNSSLVCTQCWKDVTDWLGASGVDTRCAVCSEQLGSRLVIEGGSRQWQLCRADAVKFLNSLRTVEPKLDPATFVFPSS